MMVVYALVAMVCFGVRVVISKTACVMIGTPLYIQINFLVEFCMGLLMLGLWIFGQLQLSFSTNRTLMLGMASIFQIVAEFFLFLGIEIGIVGCVVAVVSSNFVYVCIVSTLLGNSSLNKIQISGASFSFIGVISVTAGDIILSKLGFKAVNNITWAGKSEVSKQNVELTTK